MSDKCAHFEQATVFETDERVCSECVEMGSGWVQLRLCLVCGHVGCCDSSPNRHATAHYRDTHDPVIRSIEPGAEWGYCYEDDLFVERLV